MFLKIALEYIKYYKQNLIKLFFLLLFLSFINKFVTKTVECIELQVYKEFKQKNYN